MNDTCATHRSRVPRRSFGRNKRRSDDIGRREDQAWIFSFFSTFYYFRSSSVGLETGEWRRCRSLSFTPPASLRSHGSRPRPTRHNDFIIFFILLKVPNVSTCSFITDFISSQSHGTVEASTGWYLNIQNKLINIDQE